MKLIRPVLALAAAVVLTAGSVSAASAQVVRHHDARHDVRSARLDQNDDFAGRREPGRALGDVVSTVVTHTARSVRITVNARDLAPKVGATEFLFEIRTDSGARREADIIAFAHDRAGFADFTTAGGKPIACRTVHHIDYRHNRATISIPTTCLERPRWVRVAIGVATLQGKRAYVDDANLSGHVRNDLVFGKRVHRG